MINTNGVRLDCESPDFLCLGGGRMRRISDIDIPVLGDPRGLFMVIKKVAKVVKVDEKVVGLN